MCLHRDIPVVLSPWTHSWVLIIDVECFHFAPFFWENFRSSAYMTSDLIARLFFTIYGKTEFFVHSARSRNKSGNLAVSWFAEHFIILSHTTSRSSIKPCSCPSFLSLPFVEFLGSAGSPLPDPPDLHRRKSFFARLTLHPSSTFSFASVVTITSSFDVESVFGSTCLSIHIRDSESCDLALHEKMQHLTQLLTKVHYTVGSGDDFLCT